MPGARSLLIERLLSMSEAVDCIPSTGGKDLVALKFFKQAWWHMLIVLATRKAEAGESLKLRTWTPVWAI